MSFEKKELHVVAPLDVVEGERYKEPIKDDTISVDIENIYNVIRR